MNLSHILNRIGFKEFIGNKDLNVEFITHNSKEVRKNTVFVAIKGFETDGHKYIADAIEKGAIVIVCQFIPEGLESKSSYIIVDDSRFSLAEIACELYDNPSKKLDVIGVTGTNGKTSTTHLIKSITDYNKIKSGLIGTLGIVVGDEVLKTEYTTPEASEVQDIMHKMLNENTEVCLLEVSSHAIELNRVYGVDFDVAIFTNLTRDHLDFHKTMENYYLAKKKLFYRTKKSNIINVDDPFGKRLYEELKNDGVHALSYGIDNEADIKANNLRTTIKGTEFQLVIGEIVKDVYVKTPGKFSVLNSLAALGTTHCLNIDLDDSIEALAKYNGVKGRFQIADTKLDCTIILDFAHTPDGLEKVMDTINEFASSRKVVMFGAGGDRDVARRAPMGEIAGKYCDLTILTSDNPRFEDPNAICEEIAEGVSMYGGEYVIVLDREEAIYYAIKNYQKDDVILIAGKSTEPHQDYGTEKVPYDEIEVTKKMIKKVEEEMGL